METTSFPRSAANSYPYESHTNSISNEKSVPTSFHKRSSQTQRYEVPYYQEQPFRLIFTYENNNLDQSQVGYNHSEVERNLHENQTEYNFCQSQAGYNHDQNQAENRSRDKEVGFLREEMNKHYQTINEKLDKLLRKRINIMPFKPSSFPLQSIQQVEDFNNITDEEYENGVEYLHFVGGFTLHDAIKYCMKEAITDDAIQHYSAWGERGNLPLFETKLIKAIYDAVCRNSHFGKPLRDEFFREVGEAVRFGKQRNRNVTKKMSERGRGQRQRLRHAADNNLFGEIVEDNAIDNTDDANDLENN
ncbi:uncharacterized protein [Linepithema humile]|uniref:uncharacterized protein n=1 Tax=Linepithema humile TaxID=83485 RepID=UPI00351F6E13